MKTLSTKKALFASLLSMLLCVTMLIGSTFAWFTDTATTGVNKIQAGELDVVLQMSIDGENWENAENKTLNFLKKQEDGSVVQGTDILWEPGCTYELPALRVVNNGNLALKYRIVISGINGSAKLNEVIKWSINDSDINLTEKHLAAKEEGEAFTIKGHMDENAGNEYQGLTIDGISITVYATQDTIESDSKDNQYDKDATYTVTNAAGVKTALLAGGDVTINENITADASKTEVSDRVMITNPTTLTLGATYTIPGELESSDNWAALYINADTVINATGSGGINCLDKAAEGASYIGGPYVAHIMNGATVTVNGGIFHGGCTTFQVQEGTLIVNGGFFEVSPSDNTNDYRYNLNCIDRYYKAGKAKIIVKGGTFVNFDPSNNLAEGENTNFVADGYTVISETKENDDVWYTVVKAVSSASELTEAIKSASAGDTIHLGANITGTSAFSISKEITINLNGYTLSSTAHNTLKLISGANVTVVDLSDAATGMITNEYSGSADPMTVDLLADGAVFTLESGTVQSNSKDDLYTIAIGNSKKKECTVNIKGGTVTNRDGHVKSRAIVASNGMTLNMYDGTVSGGLYALDVYAGSVSNIFGGKLFAEGLDGRTDEYGTSYAIHAKGEATINIGSADSEAVPNVKGIKFESSGVKTELPTIVLVKGEITNPIYSMEAKYNYSLFKLVIVADAPVTFTDNTARDFLADDLRMVQKGSVWTVTAK